MAIHFTDENFSKEVLSSDIPVLVDFYADWCGPCKMLAPVLEKAESEVKVIKVDTDIHEELARKYGIMSIPTIILFENGQEIKRNIGFIDKERLEDFLK